MAGHGTISWKLNRVVVADCYVEIGPIVSMLFDDTLINLQHTADLYPIINFAALP